MPARRWPNRGWEERAETYLNRIMQPPGGEHLRTSPIDTEAWPRWKRGLLSKLPGYRLHGSVRGPYRRSTLGRDCHSQYLRPAGLFLQQLCLTGLVCGCRGASGTTPMTPGIPGQIATIRAQPELTGESPPTTWPLDTPTPRNGLKNSPNSSITAGRHWGSSDTGDFAPKNLRMGYPLYDHRQTYRR